MVEMNIKKDLPTLLKKPTLKLNNRLIIKNLIDNILKRYEIYDELTELEKINLQIDYDYITKKMEYSD